MVLVKDFFTNRSFNFWVFFSLIITLILSFPILSLLINVILNYKSEWNFILNIEIWDYLFNSFNIIFFQSIFVIFFGVTSAWIVTNYRFPIRKLIDICLL